MKIYTEACKIIAENSAIVTDKSRDLKTINKSYQLLNNLALNLLKLAEIEEKKGE